MGRALIITTGGGTDVEEGNPNATPQFVLSGYTFYANIDDPQIGTMPTHWPDYTHNMEPGWYLDLPWGYYTGGLTYTAKSLKDFTSATATVEQMSNGWVGWRSGAKQVGTMPWWGSTGGGSIGANGTHVVPKGQHDGGGVVNQSLWTWGWGAITPGLWNQTVIDANSWASGDRWVLGDGNLVAGNIKKGVTIFGVTGSFFIDNTNVVNGIYMIKDGTVCCPLEVKHNVSIGANTGGYIGEWQNWINEPWSYPISQNGCYIVRTFSADYFSSYTTGSSPDYSKLCVSHSFQLVFKPPITIQNYPYSIRLDMWNMTTNQIRNPGGADCVNNTVYLAQEMKDQNGNRISTSWNNYATTVGLYSFYMTRYNGDFTGHKVTEFPAIGHYWGKLTPVVNNPSCAGSTSFYDEVTMRIMSPYYLRRSNSNADDRIWGGVVSMDLYIKNLWLCVWDSQYNYTH